MPKKKVTMTDIAKQLNISTVTVSKALSNKEGVSDTLRQEILETAFRMGYTTPSLLQESRTNLTYNMGIILAKRYLNTSNSFYWHMYQKLITKFSKHNYSVILEVIGKTDEAQCICPNILEHNKVDGVILLGQLHNHYIHNLTTYNLPLVFLDFYNYQFDIDSIISDNMHGGFQLTQHLIDQGHTKIGFVGNIHATSSILDRYLGYYRCLIENNLVTSPEWIINDREADGTYIPFKLPDNCPTAFVCNCDEIAFNFITYLRQIGLRIPEDISVVGFDNYFYSNICTPPLTTISVDVNTMAETCVATMLHKISSPDVKLGRKIINCNLTSGESVKKL